MKHCWIVVRYIRFGSGGVVAEPMAVFEDQTAADRSATEESERWKKHGPGISPALALLGVTAIGHGVVRTPFQPGVGLISVVSTLNGTEG